MVPEAVQHLDRLPTELQEEMESEEVWDLEAHPEEAEEGLLEVISEVEEADQVEDFEAVEVVDLVDNELIYYPSDIQVSSKHL